MKDKKLADFLSFNTACGLRNLAVEIKEKTMATRTNNNRTYYINPAYLTFNENSGYGANLIQVSASSSCWISVYDKANGIGYSDADKNYQRWKITAYNNKFPDNDACRIYVRLERNGTSALIVYSKKVYNVDGSSADTEASADYYYIYIGNVSATDGTSIRSITYDTGYLESDQGYEDANDINEMWEWDKTSYSDWLIKAKKWLASFTVKGFIELVGGLIFKKGEIEKTITDIKRSTDNDDEVPVSDSTLPTTKYVREMNDERYLRKDKDDRSVGYIASDRGFEAGEFVQEATGAACYQDKDGNWHIETDHLRVRKKATFTEIEVQEVHHVGGQMLLTAANMIVDYVYEMDDRYRCYFAKKDNDGREVENLWRIGDQGYCNTFNLTKQADGTLGNHYLWRLVVGTNEEVTSSDEPTRTFGDVTITTTDYNYVDLSKVEGQFDSMSDAPSAGDEIVQLGHQGSDTDRQNAIVIAGAGAGSPYIYEFTGIGLPPAPFSLPEPETRIKPGDNMFSGVMRIQKGSVGAANFDDLPEEIFKAVHVGSANLLLNSGFTGDYKAESLDASYALRMGSEMYSRGLKYWTGTATVNDDAEGVSGRSVTVGSLSQSVQLVKEEKYVVTFKAKGASVKVTLGGVSQEKSLGDTYEKCTMRFDSDGIHSFSISGDATVCDLKLERGTIATDWTPSPYDNDKSIAEFQALKYIQDAIVEGNTTVLGGLILSSMIQLGNYKDGNMEKVNAGMSGIYNDDDDVAFWGGGKFEDAIRTIMKFRQNPRYIPTKEEWDEMANFVVSHGGDLFLRGTIFADGGYFRGRLEAEEGFFSGSIYAKDGTIGGFTITENDIHAVGSEVTAVNQEVTLYKDGLKFLFTGGTNGETFFGARGMSLGQDQHFVHSIFIKNNAVLQWPMCGMRMSLQPNDLGLYIEGGSTHILSSGQTIINGLTLNQVVVDSDMTLPMNADSVVFNNAEEITVTLPPSRAGKVLYLKRINEGKVTLKGNIRPQNSRDVIFDHSYEVGDSSIMLILQGVGWTIFYCG